MPMYDVTATGRYQCRGPGGQFLPPVQFAKTYQFELSSADDDFTDELYAMLDLDAPDNCVSISGVSTSIAPSAYGPGVDADIGESQPDDRPTGTPGQLVTVYATVACENQSDGSIIYRTVRVDVLWDATVDEVIEALFEAAEAMRDDNPSAYPCNIIGITVTAPAYFQYLTVA